MAKTEDVDAPAPETPEDDSDTLSLKDYIAAASEELDADIILLNAPMSSGLSDRLRAQVEERSSLRTKLVLLLVTEGGLADTAYRCARILQKQYDHITVCVAGWCKSAGTLLAMAGNDLVVGDRGELGPLDVQIAKRDELFDRDSGLISNASLDRLRDESFQFFETFMLKIISKSNNAVTFRTAADIAAQVTTGLMSPIFEKIDPLRLGADARAMQIGYAYAVRLDRKADNLKSQEALNMLLNGYPSHSFVIDFEEASMLFTRVQPLEGYLADVVEQLGDLAKVPQDQSAVLYLNEAESGDDEEQPVPDREAPGDEPVVNDGSPDAKDAAQDLH